MQRRPAIAKAFIKLNKAVMANEGRVTAEQKRLIGYLNRWNDSMATTLEQGAITAGHEHLHKNEWQVGKHQ